MPVCHFFKLSGRTRPDPLRRGSKSGQTFQNEALMHGERQVFHALDGLRGLAALAVVERHKTEFFTGTPLPAGYLAVDLFFILSGFVLAHAYGARLAEGLSVKAFMAARIIRLAPLYMLATAFSAFLYGMLLLGRPDDAASANLTWMNWITSVGTGMLMLPTPEAWSFAPDRLFPLNDPAWSLFFEVIINLVFAAFILVLNRGTLILLAGAGLIGLSLSAFAHGGIDIGFDWATVAAGFPRVTFGFFTGVLLHRLWLERNSPLWLQGANANCATWMLGVAMLAAMAAPVADAWRPLWEIAMVALVFPMIVYAGACLAPSGMSLKAFGWLGAASYGIYVFHLPAARAFGEAVKAAGLDPAGAAPWTGIMFAGLLFLAALLLDRWFDRPVRKWLASRRRADVTPAFRAARADLRRGVTP
jgi:peptidoglycan/LPS O-acetylase OafA/YrhL